MEKEIIFEALYNDCFYESSYATISIHKTREGAEKAIEEHKAAMKVEYEKEVALDVADGLGGHSAFPYEWQAWDIKETELLE